MRVWCRLFLLGLVAAVSFGQAYAQSQFVIFKVKTPFDVGKVVPDSARQNDFYVRIGTDRGIQIGMTMNVYRDKELVSEIGSFKFKTTQFIGRVRVYDAQREFTVARTVELASHGDPHLDRVAVMIGDYVQPVFVVSSENLFDKGSSTLRPEAIRELDRAVNFISRSDQPAYQAPPPQRPYCRPRSPQRKPFLSTTQPTSRPLTTPAQRPNIPSRPSPPRKRPWQPTRTWAQFCSLPRWPKCRERHP